MERPAFLPQTPEPVIRDPDPLHTPDPIPSIPSTTTPLCPHFGPCGGCQLQHLRYSDQLASKRDTLATLLSAAGIPDPPPIHTHTADPWRYRNRIRLRVERTPTGFELGYNQHASNTFLPIHTCPIAAPSLIRAAQTLLALPDAAPWLASTAELELFATPDESRLQLTLHLRSAPAIPPSQQPRSFSRLGDALQQQVPALAGAGASLLRPHHTNSARHQRPSRKTAAFTPVTWGAPGLLYPVPLAPAAPPTPLWVSRPSFFQTNRHLLPTLVHLATRCSTAPQPAPPQPLSSRPEAKGRSGETRFSTTEAEATADPLWDLFAGVGLFTRALAPHASAVVAVESSAASTADLASARLPDLRIVTGTVLDFLRSAVLDRDRPSLVLLDPPRAGLGPESTVLLTQLAPARIVYVSCDPTSLSRDLAAMLSSGYNLAELHLVDMFPQTVHLETVALLTRS